MPKRNYIILIGNPGTGKSTILNSFVGSAAFKSGVSFGEGLTKVLQLHQHGDTFYGDTPGLADVSLRKAAAEAISEALKQDGSYKLIFVITLEAGRARPQDVSTIKLVMDALPAGTPYGIIINKLSDNMMKHFNDHESDLKKVKSSLDTEKFVAFDLYTQPSITSLIDADNVVVAPSQELKDWIDNLPATVIESEDVGVIKQHEFEAEMERAEAIIKKLATDMALAEERFKQQQSALLKQIDELKRRPKRPWWKIW
jgi:GTPase Era involved in 16S rRNA processing